MTNKIFAKKIGMTGKFTTGGMRVGVTILEALPMVVNDLRTIDKHGYKAVSYKLNDNRYKSKTIYREVRTEETPEKGLEIKLEDTISVGDEVKISGVIKGKGFAGAVKRHGFAGGPRTHGQSDRERAPGSSGSGTTPGRVYKGKRRAGHMGNQKKTISGLKVLDVDIEKRLIFVVGSVPGVKTGLVEIIKV